MTKAYHNPRSIDASEPQFKHDDQVEYLRQIQPEVWVGAKVIAVYTYENSDKIYYGVKAIKSGIRTDHVAAHVRSK